MIGKIQDARTVMKKWKNTGNTARFAEQLKKTSLNDFFDQILMIFLCSPSRLFS